MLEAMPFDFASFLFLTIDYLTLYTIISPRGY
jgi:hypothetical protein